MSNWHRQDPERCATRQGCAIFVASALAAATPAGWCQSRASGTSTPTTHSPNVGLAPFVMTRPRGLEKFSTLPLSAGPVDGLAVAGPRPTFISHETTTPFSSWKLVSWHAPGYLRPRESAEATPWAVGFARPEPPGSQPATSPASRTFRWRSGPNADRRCATGVLAAAMRPCPENRGPHLILQKFAF